MREKNVKIGMKVVPNNKSIGIIPYNEWLKTIHGKYFLKHGYLYVQNKFSDKDKKNYFMLNTKIVKTNLIGSKFLCSDFEPYENKEVVKYKFRKGERVYVPMPIIGGIKYVKGTVVQYISHSFDSNYSHIVVETDISYDCLSENLNHIKLSDNKQIKTKPYSGIVSPESKLISLENCCKDRIKLDVDINIESRYVEISLKYEDIILDSARSICDIEDDFDINKGVMIAFENLKKKNKSLAKIYKENTSNKNEFIDKIFSNYTNKKEELPKKNKEVLEKNNLFPSVYKQNSLNDVCVGTVLKKVKIYNNEYSIGDIFSITETFNGLKINIGKGILIEDNETIYLVVDKSTLNISTINYTMDILNKQIKEGNMTLKRIGDIKTLKTFGTYYYK